MSLIIIIFDIEIDGSLPDLANTDETINMDNEFKAILSFAKYFWYTKKYTLMTSELIELLSLQTAIHLIT